MPAEPIEGRQVRLTTLALTAVSTLIIELAIAEPDRPRATTLGATLGLLLAPTLLAAWVLGRSRYSRTRLGSSAVLGILGVFSLPALAQVGAGVFGGRGAPLEIVLLAMLRNLGLSLAALAHRRSCARLAALVSLFLVLVGASLADDHLVLGLVGLHALTGTLWLMQAYWEGLLAGRPEVRRGLPASAMVWLAVVVGVLVTAVAVGPTRAATMLAALVPSSGGNDWNDPEARSGVNDGDNEVAASENPQSVGFTDSEVYLETDKSSLYDAFNEQYGEPFKRNKHERMFALNASQVTEQKERPSENLKAGREFSMVRQRPVPKARPADRPTRSLAYVKGPTPLHLRLTAFDWYDGRVWTEDRPSPISLPATLEKGSSWIALDGWPPPIYAQPVTHQIKIGTLQSSPIPTPPHLLRFKVGSVADADFFDWAQEEILRIKDRTLPASTVVDVQSSTVDPSLIRRIGFPEAPSWATARYLGRPFQQMPGTPYATSPEVAALAESWVSGIPRGWLQVEAVVDRLRTEYAHDRAAESDPDAADPLADFLLRTRRGPDYLFATAAAQMLRHLNYPTRVVSGFYASPAKFDLRSRHTPIEREDVHFWAEVLIPGRSWVVIEPTPGYEVLGPARHWSERLAQALADGLRWCSRHAAELTLTALASLAIYWRRRELLDLLATLGWRVAGGRRPDRLVLRTLRLVESRSRRAGRQRPDGLTPARWYGSMASTAPPELRDDLGRLIAMVDVHLYAPDGAAGSRRWSDGEIRDACRRAIQGWTLGRFRSVETSFPLVPQGMNP